MVVPRKCFFEDQPSEIIDWATGEIDGPEEEQVIKIARWAKQMQGMTYKVGAAFVVEDFDLMIQNPTTDTAMLSPVRIAAMLGYAARTNQMGDARIVMQGRTIAKTTITDDRLKRLGYWTSGSDHERDATRHVITALRRASQDWDLRDELWNADICVLNNAYRNGSLLGQECPAPFWESGQSASGFPRGAVG